MYPNKRERVHGLAPTTEGRIFCNSFSSVRKFMRFRGINSGMSIWQEGMLTIYSFLHLKESGKSFFVPDS